jgi:glyoxylase-like metal-dependent hydrolase (beta-lactamase superfamily II)
MDRPAFLTWQVGRVKVTRIVELEMLGGTRFILPDATREAVIGIDWLKPHFMNDEGRLRMSIHALVVETPTRRIVVDTCLGNDKTGRSVPHWNELQEPFLADLAAAGYPRETIDTVLCTHLHVDHVGWNTMLVDGVWVPTFPNARYLVAQAEHDAWRTRTDAEQAQILADSVQPVFDAGLVDLVATDHQVCNEVRLIPTHGHTLGHVSIAIESEGARALITGDFVHHPCQMARLDWGSPVDHDPAQARATRETQFAALAGGPTLVIGTHFAAPTAGYVVADGAAYRFKV